ncbi:MAG: signal peptidase I [Clostridiales bacterium]|nr:signal peptidase I [Clostridiales bacterium]
MFKKTVLYVMSAILGIGVAFALSWLFMLTTVMGSGMEPALPDGSKALIFKEAGIGEISKQGNVVAFWSDVYGEEGEGSILIRRVAASEGDSVEIREDVLYVNGKPYAAHMKEPVHMEDMKKVSLRANQLFLMSDNRKSTMDSRNDAIGIVDARDCIGKICFN